MTAQILQFKGQAVFSYGDEGVKWTSQDLTISGLDPAGWVSIWVEKDMTAFHCMRHESLYSQQMHERIVLLKLLNPELDKQVCLFPANTQN